jgi:hypothetical protein
MIDPQKRSELFWACVGLGALLLGGCTRCDCTPTTATVSNFWRAPTPEEYANCRQICGLDEETFDEEENVSP